MEQKPMGEMYDVESTRKDEEYVGKKNCSIFRALSFAMNCMHEPETIEVSIRSVRTADKGGQPFTLRKDGNGNWFAEW